MIGLSLQISCSPKSDEQIDGLAWGPRALATTSRHLATRAVRCTTYNVAAAHVMKAYGVYTYLGTYLGRYIGRHLGGT